MTRNIEIERFSLTTSKQFDEVVAGVYAAIGHPDMAEFGRSTHEARSFAELKSAVEKGLSKAGLIQLGCIERQIRTIDATNICTMTFLLVIHPSISRLQTGNICRQTIEEIVGWNHGLRIIFPYDCIDLSAREY